MTSPSMQSLLTIIVHNFIHKFALKMVIFTDFQCDFGWGRVRFSWVWEQDVARFQVSVNNSFRVQSFHCTCCNQTQHSRLWNHLFQTYMQGTHRKDKNILHIENLSSPLFQKTGIWFLDLYSHVNTVMPPMLVLLSHVPHTLFTY